MARTEATELSPSQTSLLELNAFLDFGRTLTGEPIKWLSSHGQENDEAVFFFCNWAAPYNKFMRKDPIRLTELRRQLILDSSVEKAYDDITKMMSESLDVPIAMINFMDVDRDWFKSRVGFPMTESPAHSSFCESFFSSDKDVIVVPDTLQS